MDGTGGIVHGFSFHRAVVPDERVGRWLTCCAEALLIDGQASESWRIESLGPGGALPLVTLQAFFPIEGLSECEGRYV